MIREKKISAYRKLNMLFLGALIPIIASNFLMLHVAYVRIREKESEKMDVELALRVDSFDNEIGRINSGLRFHVMNNEESSLANNYYSLSSYQLGQRVAELNERLNELSLISSCIEDITVYMPRIEREISLTYYYDDHIAQSDLERISKYRYEDNGNVYSNGNMRVHMVAPTSKDKIPLFIMEAVLSNSKILSFIGQGESEKYGLIGKDWTICEPIPEIIESALEEIRIQEEGAGNLFIDDYLLCYHRMSLCDGWMIGYAKTSELMQDVGLFRLFIATTFFTTVITLLVVAFLLSRSVNRPFQELSRMFEEVREGSLDTKTNYQFRDEFRIVFEQFDNMISRIKGLVAQSVEQGKALQRSEYRQLQEHIAPHFLYNSFNVLRHCLLMEDYETSTEMAKLLGNYFRYITYVGELDSISLLEEYQHARDYLEIQKIRFQDNITVEMDELPKECNYIRVPPFILQPLIENVFKHGIKDMAYAGRIVVRVAKKESGILLKVVDNGSGVDCKELDKLRKAINGGETPLEHSGLANIEKRLKILFGDKAGLTVNSEKNLFFEVSVYVPFAVQAVDMEVREDD